MEEQELMIETDSIKLDQFLKWSGSVSTGGHAKVLINEGKVKVNNVVEKRRGKLLIPGDLIEIEHVGSFRITPSN